MFPSLGQVLPRLIRVKCFSYSQTCAIVTSRVNRLKEIKIEETNDEIKIEAMPCESIRTDYLVPHDAKNCKSCPLCRLNLKRLQFSDVLILNQFIDSSGELLHQSVSGLCKRSQRKVQQLVKQAQAARLLPRPLNHVSNGPWEDLNRYFEYPKRKRDQPMHVVRPKYWE